MSRTRNAAEKKKLLHELQGPPIPQVFLYLWQWFGELNAERDYTSMGTALPLKSKDIKAWMELWGRFPLKHELECLRDLDLLYLKAVDNGGPKNKDSQDQNQHRNRR